MPDRTEQAAKFRGDAAYELDLALEVGSYAQDPLGFVHFAYPWGAPGPLAAHHGPREWQAEFLFDLGTAIRRNDFDGATPVEPVRFSTSSGHGIGKSALVAMLSDFVLSTRPFCKGVVTANTFAQLETKTFAEIIKWTKMLVNAHWWRYSTGRGAMRLVHKDHRENWRLDAVAWVEGKSEAFAGLHAANSSPFYIFDEASGIPKKIFEVAKGGMTDGEPFEFLFGNPTKNSGYFHETHTELKHRYICRKIDSRSVEGTNKEYLQELIDDYGENSDTVRVRVLGEFPLRSFLQFIDAKLVDQAIKLNKPVFDREAVRVMGCDVARQGNNSSVICYREGYNADLPDFPWESYPELSDTMEFADKIAAGAERFHPDAIFVDGSGVGGPVVDRLRQLKVANVIEVNGSNASADPNFAFKMDEMWGNLRTWLKRGKIPDDPKLKAQLIARNYEILPKRGAVSPIKLESKKMMEKDDKPSPDEADALGLSLAYPVKKAVHDYGMYGHNSGAAIPVGSNGAYDPISVNEHAYETF